MSPHAGIILCGVGILSALWLMAQGIEGIAEDEIRNNWAPSSGAEQHLDQQP